MAPKHKGDRDAIYVRPPREIGDVIRQQAAERGMNVSDYATALFAEYIGLNHLAPMLPPKPEQELPLSA